MAFSSLIKNNENMMFIIDTIKQFYFKHLISDEKLIAKRFQQRLGRKVELENPIMFNDKLQWLKLNWHDPLMTQCADKFMVREFIKETIGEKYLNNLIAVYESVDEIDINSLPKSFVLKVTHGSGFNIICKNKNMMNWKQEFKKMRRWMRLNYYLSKREWGYKNIKPRIVCEKYLEDADSEELKDYKFFCFNGEPKIIEVDFGLFKDHRRNYYDLEWNLLELEIEFPSDPNLNIKAPESLNEMIELSRIISENFPFVRVDFYNAEERVIFGELTFYSDSGFGKINPTDFEKKMGEWLILPNQG